MDDLEFKFRLGQEIFFSNKSRPASPHPTSHSKTNGVLSRGYSGRSVKLTTHHLLPRLIMSGAVRLLHPYIP